MSQERINVSPARFRASVMTRKKRVNFVHWKVDDCV